MSKSKTPVRKKKTAAAGRKKNFLVRYLSFELGEFRRFANPARYNGFFLLMLALFALLPALAFVCYLNAWMTEGGMASQSEVGNSFVYLGAFQYFNLFLVLGVVLLAGTLLYLLTCSFSAKALKELAWREPWHFCFLFLLLWSVPGLLFSEDPDSAWTGTPLQYDGLRTYLIIAAVYLAACFLKGREKRLLILRIFTTACTFCTVLMFGQIYRWPVIYDVLFHTASSVMVNLNHFGYYLCTSIVLLAALFLYDRGKIRSVWYAASFAFQVYGLLLNDTFGSYVAVVFTLFAMALFHWKSGRKWRGAARRLALLAAVLAALSVFCYLDVAPSPTGRKFSRNFSKFSSDVAALAEGAELNIGNGGSGRLLLWKEALELIPEHPLLGFGPNGMPDDYNPEDGLTRPHNSFIQIAVFHGIPGAAAYIAGLLFLFLRKWKELEELDESVLVSAAGTTAFLVSSFFGVPMFYTSPYLFLLLGFDSTPERGERLREDTALPAGTAEAGESLPAPEETGPRSGAERSDEAAAPDTPDEAAGKPLVNWRRLGILIACVLLVAGIAAYLVELRLEKRWEEQDVIFMELAYQQGRLTALTGGLTEPALFWLEPDEGILVRDAMPAAYGAGTRLRGYHRLEDFYGGTLEYDMGADYAGKVLEVYVDPQLGKDGVTVRWVPAG